MELIDCEHTLPLQHNRTFLPGMIRGYPASVEQDGRFEQRCGSHGRI